MTAPMLLSRPSAASGQTVRVPTTFEPGRRYHLSWAHRPEGSVLLYVGGPTGSPVQVTAAVLGRPDSRQIVAGYIKLVGQSSDEAAINAARRARRDRARPLRSL
jgi:hypothetical protein